VRIALKLKNGSKINNLERRIGPRGKGPQPKCYPKMNRKDSPAQTVWSTASSDLKRC